MVWGEVERGHKSDRLSAAVWCLRVVFVVQCVGMLRWTLAGGSAFTTTMFMDLGWHEPTSYTIEVVGAYLLLGCALWTLVTGSRWGAAYGAVWFLSLAALATFQGGAFLSELTVPAHATRFGVAIALALWPSLSKATAAAEKRNWEWVLRVVIAATFATHGIEALYYHPRFIDFLIRASDVMLGLRLTESQSHWLLIAIGIIDIALAIALLSGKRWRFVVGYMAVWGVATAAMRTIYIGPTGVGQTLVRAANAGLPLALLIAWQVPRAIALRKGKDHEATPHQPVTSPG